MRFFHPGPQAWTIANQRLAISPILGISALFEIGAATGYCDVGGQVTVIIG
jgi:hypothetical protein